MTWGHAVSPDMFHWTQLDQRHPARQAGHDLLRLGRRRLGQHGRLPDGRREDHRLHLHLGRRDLAESKGQPFTQSIAYSNDRGRTLTKYAKNPVLKHIVGGNRDPKVFGTPPSKKWIMALYLDGNTYALFSLAQSEGVDASSATCPCPAAGECPDFFELPVDGDAAKTKWVFWGGQQQLPAGHVRRQDVHARRPGRCRSHFGANHYAAQTFSDIPAADGRRIQIAWMAGGKYPGHAVQPADVAAGVLTLRTFPEGVRLCTLPVKEIESLHKGEKFACSGTLKPGENPLAGISGDLFDIELKIEPGTAKRSALNVRGTPIVTTSRAKQLSCLGNARPRSIWGTAA